MVGGERQAGRGSIDRAAVAAALLPADQCSKPANGGG
jgi:hypothetical protein